ncbi:asparaginyl-tRNA synthetase [Culicoides brevitarsis]|uniref:asparaginyl-tRNA synthetase n=1 Tax=Culicoides brevitarsis TaxID=469753 RepID=UPI00307B3EF5
MFQYLKICRRTFSDLAKDVVTPPIVRQRTTTRLKDLLASKNVSPDEKHFINGWVTKVRKMKTVTFLNINDGTCNEDLQIVVGNKLSSDFNVGSSIQATGNLGTTPRGQIELQVTDIDLVNTCKHPEYPFITKQQHLPQYVREFIHLRSRHKPFAATMRVRHAAQKAFHDFFDAEGFVNIHTPILTSNDCENSGEVFLARPESADLLKQMKRDGVPEEASYFDKKTFLTVSGQLHLEAMCLGLDKVYTFNPAFRAENSKSPHHLAEFYMLEGEIAFMERLEDLTALLDDMIKGVTRKLLDSSSNDISYLTSSDQIDFSWLEKETPTITYHEALKILEANRDKIDIPVNPKEGLAKNHELFLTKYVNGPCFVAHFPKDIKPFYMRQNHEDPTLVDCFDFLVPEVGELIGGSVREHKLELLEKNLPNKEDLEWYLDLRRYGSACTSGFGMGFERYLQWLLNVKNIRDVIPFPRWPHHCDT